MIRLIVTEKTYKKGSSWKQLSYDEYKSLCASVDIEDDDLIPVEERDPGEWFFTENFSCRFYKIESTLKDEDENDFCALEYLREIDFKDLREWFFDVPLGNNILEIRWEKEQGWMENESDREEHLIITDIYLEK